MTNFKLQFFNYKRIVQLKTLVSKFNKAALNRNSLLPHQTGLSFQPIKSLESTVTIPSTETIVQEIKSLPVVQVKNNELTSYQLRDFIAAVKTQLITLKKISQEKIRRFYTFQDNLFGPSEKLRSSIIDLESEFHHKLTLNENRLKGEDLAKTVKNILGPLPQREKEHLLREYKRKINLNDLLVHNYKLLGIDQTDAELARKINMERKKLLETIQLEVLQAKIQNPPQNRVRNV